MTPDDQLAAAMRADLERRVREISRTDARVFGQIGPVEWTLAMIGFVVLPLALWWWLG
jgi:hypothetical protein